MLPALIPGLEVLVKIICEVPALKVRFVEVANAATPTPLALNVTVELPRLIVRVLVLLDDRDAAVTL